jgi:hypothetical protein
MTDSVTKKGCPKIHIDTSFLCEPVRSQEGERRKCMLIRSQDKTALVKFENIVVNLKLPDSLNAICWSWQDAQRSGGYFILGKYSTKEKAMKVLDMIQEAYADAELIPMTVPNIGKMFAEASASKENELLAEAIGKVLMNKMVFQMPEDSEVEA